MLFQVALDAIEELCFEMSLHRPEAIEEYAIFVVTHRGKLQLSHFKNKQSKYIEDIAFVNDCGCDFLHCQAGTSRLCTPSNFTVLPV